MSLREKARGRWSGRASRRTVEIKDAKTGTVAFRQEGVEAPESWSDRAVEQPARLYFRTIDGKRETSVISMVRRVVGAITEAATRPDVGTPLFLAGSEDLRNFSDNLTAILLDQRAAFNTPVWINAGAAEKPQCSACFIQSVDDSMESLTALQHSETMLFRNGSGTGSDFSRLRPQDAALSRGGTASGPVSFMRGLDGWAGVTKSGGKARRAAKMNSLSVSHPDIMRFIESKVEAQRMIRALVAAGWDDDFNATATSWIPYQNANHSVRVPDAFMRAVEDDGLWVLRFGDHTEFRRAREIWDAICRAAWECGDPGLQFDDTINHWHTSPHAGRINASNPCCLVGETEVDTSEGKIPIAVLEAMNQRGESLPFAFAFDTETNLPVLRPINKVWIAGETESLVEVRTDKGVVVRCTPDHRFLLRDGTYVEARQLREGDRLRKIGRGVNKNRSGRHQLYHRIVDGETGPYDTVWQSRFMWEQAYGAIPDDMEVHHKNEDATDDRLSNFELRERLEHRREHSRGESNPRFIATEVATLVELWEEIERTPKLRHNAPGKPLVTPGRWNAFIRAKGLEGTVPKALAKDGGRVRGMAWAAFAAWIDEHRGEVNDRVLSVTHLSLDKPVVVYDLEVEGVHNFAVGSTLQTIVVHNSEYMYLDDSACNLASMNLCKYYGEEGFDTRAFAADARTMFIAMEAIVGMAGYPTSAIAKNSRDHRPLGLGYANLGAMLMRMGLPYDSDSGRAAAASVTSLLAATAYCTSAEIAAQCGGPFSAYRAPEMLRVVNMHQRANKELLVTAAGLGNLSRAVAEEADVMWDQAIAVGTASGFRNAQATLLAPTGTIGFMMDCDTTGIEPETALVRRKHLASGGDLKLMNGSVAIALASLGYSHAEVLLVNHYLVEHETLDGCGVLREKDRPVFHTSLGFEGWVLRPEAHVLMCAAVQPFLSGAISKTVNLPADCTIEDIGAMYQLAWREGMKAVAVYRDGCKGSQPLKVKTEHIEDPTKISAQEMHDMPPEQAIPLQIAAWVSTMPPTRRRLPAEVKTVRRKIELEGHDFYFHIGLYPDGRPGEMFVSSQKEGSIVKALLDQLATAVSIALQYGAPFDVFLSKMAGTRFDPSGFTGDPEFPAASSFLDAFAQWARKRFSNPSAPAVEESSPARPEESQPPAAPAASTRERSLSGRLCRNGCGPMLQDGTCWRCAACGDNTGGCGG